MQFEQVRVMLTDRFGPTSVHQTNHLLQLAFPHISRKRLTVLTGLRPRSPSGTTSLHSQSTPESSLEAGQPTAMSLSDGKFVGPSAGEILPIY